MTVDSKALGLQIEIQFRPYLPGGTTRCHFPSTCEAARYFSLPRFTRRFVMQGMRAKSSGIPI